MFASAQRWEVKGKQYLDYPLKYYCEDPGLRNARLDFRDVEPSHMLENVIFNELLLRGCQVDVGVVPIGDKRHEIDFVVNDGERIAQLVIARCEQGELTLVEQLDETERGTAGFGSTGV